MSANTPTGDFPNALCTTGYWHVMPQQGWECPRCNAINAPHIPQCFCKPGENVITSTTSTEPAAPTPNKEESK